MKFKPFVATALLGLLSSSVIEARTIQNLASTGWNGGTTIIGNMRAITTGVGGGKRITLNPTASNLEIVGQFINTNKKSYGIIFEDSSYNAVSFTDTTFEFSQMISTSSMSGIYFKNNSMNLSFGSSENIDVLFKYGLTGRSAVSGIVADRSNIALNAGTIQFQEKVSSDGDAHGFLVANGTTSETTLQLSDGENTRRPSAIVDFNIVEGRNAYGLKYTNNQGTNVLDIRQNSSLDQANKSAGGIYFNQIIGKNGDAGLFIANGNSKISINGKSIIRTNLVQATAGASLISVYNGNTTISLTNGATLSANEVSSNRDALGFDLSGFNGYADPSMYSTIKVYGGSNIDIGRIYSNNQGAYGVFTDKILLLDLYGDNSSVNFGSISANMQNYVPLGDAYGIKSNSSAEIKIINGGRVNFESIQGKNACGVFASNNITINPQGNSTITFKSIYAGGREGEKAIGLFSERNIKITPAINGKVIFESITSKSEANGIRVYGGLTIDHTGDPYQSGKGSGVTFKNIQTQGHNAIGIYDPSVGLFDFKGGGRTTFERIEYTGNGGGSVYTAAGIVVDQYTSTLNITGGHELLFNTISSYNDAFGMRVAGLDLSMNGASLLKFGSITANNGVTGIRAADTFNSWINERSRIVLGDLTTQNGDAYALRMQRGGHLWLDNSTFENNSVRSTNGRSALIYANSGSIIVDNSSSLSTQNISARNEAEGVKTDGDLQFKADNSSSATFASVNATNGNAYGIKTGGRATVWTRNGGNITFRNITGSSNSAGILASNIETTVEQRSVLRFDTIHTSNGMAVGLQANEVSLTSINNGQIYFGNITSDAEANGIRVANRVHIDLSRSSTADRVVFQNVESNSGNALGIYTYGNNANVMISGSGSNVAFKNITHSGNASNRFAGGIVSDGTNLNLSVLNSNHLWFDLISSDNEAFGIRSNGASIYVEEGSSIHFINLRARKNAYGIFSFRENVNIFGGGEIKFNSITSSQSNAYGINTAGATLSIDNTSLIFGSKSDGNRYGIYNNINGLNFSLGDASIVMFGNNTQAIYSTNNAEAIISIKEGKALTLETKSSDFKERNSIGGNVTINLGIGSDLVFNSNAGNIKKLNVSNHATINLLGTYSRNTTNLQLRQLTVESWNGSGANVLLYANGMATIDTSGFDGRAYQPTREKAWYGGSDRIVINGTNTSGVQNNTLNVALSTIDRPTKYVLLAEVGGNAKDSVIFNGLTYNKAHTTTQTEVGFEEGNITITRYDANNKAYYVGEIPDASTFRLNRSRASQVGETQNASASVVSANFNNLNKRMGELRENPHSQGVWARVFNGEVESDFGFGSSSTYTTVQAGYDYNLSSDLDSNSYLGVAFSYLNSKTDNVVSETQGNGVEVGAYFAYVKDDGLYTDSIIKVAYMSNSNSGVSGYSLSDTDNTSFILSQEVGYQAEVVSGFYLTPQFETTYAYLGGSEMTSTYNGGSMKSIQDATNTWRNRLGLQASYKLKSEDNKFNASFYAMGSYTYDLISGGDTTFETTSKETIANPTKSDGRFVLNVGSNINIKDATRLYLDFEKSFGGKINTNYQINVGVRYSFGEKNSSK